MTEQLAHILILVWFALFLWVDPLFDHAPPQPGAPREIQFTVNGKTSILYHLPKKTETFREGDI